MGVYHYQAVNRTGEIESGRIEADSLERATEALNRNALLPIRLEEAASRVAWSRWLARSGTTANKIKRQDVVVMTQQIASLVRAGLTLDRSLSISLQLAETPGQRRLLEDLSQRVRRGASFAEALDVHKQDFPGYYISMVRAGEAGGALPEILERLSQLLVRSQEMRQKVLSALIYPAILLAMIGLTLVLILSFVLPRFESLFAEAGGQLPLPTRVVMGLGHVVQSYGWLMAAALALSLLLGRRAWRQPENRLRFDQVLLRLRLIGPVIRKIESARFARTLGTLIGGGMPVPASLRIARGSVYNNALAEATDQVLRGVTEGQGFADRLAQTHRFPALLIQMVRVGEETGRLHEGLLEAAEMLDRDAQRAIERGLVVLVPVITILMGALVAGLIGSVLVGILSVNDLAF